MTEHEEWLAKFTATVALQHATICYTLAVLQMVTLKVAHVTMKML